MLSWGPMNESTVIEIAGRPAAEVIGPLMSLTLLALIVWLSLLALFIPYFIYRIAHEMRRIREVLEAIRQQRR